MAFVTHSKATPSNWEMIAQGIGTGLSEGITTRLNTMLENKNKLSQGNALATAFGKPELGATFAKIGPDMSKLLIEQYGVENLSDALAKIAGMNTQQPSAQGQQQQPSAQGQQQQPSAQGMDQSQEAPSMRASPQRQDVPQANQQDLNFQEMIRKAPPNKRNELIKAYQDQKQFSSKAQADLEGERYKTGLPIYIENSERLKSLKDDSYRFEILQTLNDGDNLPKEFGRLNIDSDGNLRFPAAAHPDAQRYVKTLNEFSANAKDTFGARVTNFDLQQYLKRYPTLLNSKKGREQLLKQMKTVNQINRAYYGELKKVYDEAGGVRKIDADKAAQLSEERSAPIIDQLQNRFKEIDTFQTLPAASEFKGRTINNKKTGESLKSDGENWIPVNEKSENKLVEQ